LREREREDRSGARERDEERVDDDEDEDEDEDDDHHQGKMKKSLRSNNISLEPPGGWDTAGNRRSLSRFFKEMESETITTGNTYNEGERRQIKREGGDNDDANEGRKDHYWTSNNVRSYAIFSDSEDNEEDNEDLEDKILRRQLALEEHERRMKRRQERATRDGSSRNVKYDEEDEEEDEEYYDDGYDYFRFCQEKKATTNHSFSTTLKAPIQELMEIDVKKEHHAQQEKRLRMDVRSEFLRWRAQLLEGFNILLYGLGSKKNTLEKFATHHSYGVSCCGEVFVINGYFQSSSLISQLLRLLTASLGLRGRGATIGAGSISNSIPTGGNALLEQCLIVRQQIAAKEKFGLRVFVMINNIDTLRDAQDQMMLSLLAETINVHLVATVDHINSAALWDGETMGRFNWLWHEVTPFSKYDYETRHDNQLLKVGNLTTSTSNVKTVSYVLTSLTENARKIFSVLAMHQLEDPQSLGLTLSQWFSICEEKLYATSETAMKHQLRELTDHKIVLQRKGKTGLDYLYINLSPAALSQTLSEISK